MAEYEADSIGVRLMAKACYDPQANVSMLAKLNAVQAHSGEGAMPELLSTHPLTGERVVRVKNQLSDAFKLYDQHCSRMKSLFTAGWG